MTERTKARVVEERRRAEFTSLSDFYRRVLPTPEEMEALIRVGACDGFGRLPEGASAPGDTRAALRGQAHLGFDWRPSERWLVHHGVLQGEPSSYGGRRGGLVEAFAQFRPSLDVQTWLSLRAGTFFPQTSLENGRERLVIIRRLAACEGAAPDLDDYRPRFP